MSIDIAAPARTIFELASATARWPLILPHYRYVRVHAGDGQRQTVEMAVWRHCFPLRWVAEQINDPDRPSIGFRHIAGPTTGMEVEWRFEEAGDATRVTIVHRIDFRFPVAAGFVERYIVVGYFIEGVARRTLDRIKRVAEAAAPR